MKPSIARLLSEKEAALVVSTETGRLESLSEDDLVDLLARVRRARNKYSDLHRRQSAGAVRSAGNRGAAAKSNERTLRKAEVFEDAVSRVARHVAKAARANADHVKEQRLRAAGTARPKKNGSKSGTATKKRASRKSTQATKSRAAARPTTGSKSKRAAVAPARVGATSAANKRSQAARDTKKGSS